MALALLTRMSMPPKRHRLLHRGEHVGLVADVGLQRQRAAAGGLDLGRGAVDRAGQLGVGLGRLGRDDDVGAVARGAQRWPGRCRARRR
jgi:hypothetical protein